MAFVTSDQANTLIILVLFCLLGGASHRSTVFQTSEPRPACADGLVFGFLLSTERGRDVTDVAFHAVRQTVFNMRVGRRLRGQR